MQISRLLSAIAVVLATRDAIVQVRAFRKAVMKD
jgi:hypothetical protein